MKKCKAFAIRPLLRNRRGDTLVEVMVGAMLLIMAALMMSTGFILVQRMILEGNRTRDAGQAASAVAEGADAEEKDVDVQSENGVCTIKINGKMLVFNGQYNLFSANSKKETKFTVFEPDAYISPRTMYQLMANMPAFWSSLTLEQKKALLPSFATQASNDVYRAYLLKYTYQDAWPTFPPEKLPKNGTNVYGGGNPVYIQPYMFKNTDGSGWGANGVVIFANTTMGSNWYTGMVYDYEFDCWYYGPGSMSITMANEQAVMDFIRTSPKWYKLDEWNQTHP